MKKIWISITVIAVFCLTVTGCSTFKTQQESLEMYSVKNPGGKIGTGKPGTKCSLAQPHVFSGTVQDFTLIMGPALCDDFTKDGGVALWGCLALPYGLIDLPFSLVADTIILPYTIYRQSTYGNIKNSGD